MADVRATGSPPSFRAALREARIGQTQFCNLVHEIGGHSLPLRTVQGWCAKPETTPATAWAVLRLLQQQTSP